MRKKRSEKARDKTSDPSSQIKCWSLTDILVEAFARVIKTSAVPGHSDQVSQPQQKGKSSDHPLLTPISNATSSIRPSSSPYPEASSALTNPPAMISSVFPGAQESQEGILRNSLMRE